MQDNSSISVNEIKSRRPLSPHLSVYKPQISSVLSIGHRVTGFGLFISTTLMIWWFALWVFSGFDAWYLTLLDHVIIKAMLFLTIYGYCYHLCTGIRHLFWDIGIGFEKSSINFSGWIVIVCSVILASIFLYIMVLT